MSVSRPPFFQSPTAGPSIAAMLRHGVSDPASLIPAAIYETWALKLPGPFSPLVVTDPTTVRQVMLDRGNTFGRNRYLRTLMRRGWGSGLAAAENADWDAQHRAAAPAFRPAAVGTAMTAMRNIVGRAAAQWPTDRPVEMRQAVGAIVVEIVLATLLGGDALPDTAEIAADMPRVMQEIARFDLLDVMPLPARWIERLRGNGRSREEARLRAVAALLATRATASSPSANDLRALLRDVAPLADNVFGFMLAGFETSALAVAWSLYLLALHPDWQEAIHAEAVADGTSGDALPLARQVAEEALRLYPPAPLLVRAATRRTTLLGHTLRRGQAVLIPVFAIHRHRHLWDDPDAFVPDRFDPVATPDRRAYLPFGVGQRQCIAARFALTEIVTIVSGLVRSLHSTRSKTRCQRSVCV